MPLHAETALSPAQVWWLAIRPRTLTLAVVPVLVGAVLAWHEAQVFRALPFIAALVSALAIQIGTNLLNDASDGENGFDRPGRLGPPRITASGWATAAEVRRAALAAFLVATVAGLYCVAVGGLPILAVGIASLLAGWAYSRGPLPIAASATGEVFVLIFFGVAAVAGTAWLMSLKLSLAAVMSGILIGLPSSAVLLINNHRDREADAAAGRRTLAIVLGLEATRLFYVGLLTLAAVMGIFVALALGSPWMLLTLLALPYALRLSHMMMDEPIGSGLNALLGRTASYQIVLAALLIFGLMM
ncbi:MAG: 1,4-dihydroxy-2-naphthoate octaprenyltransferase [Xanthobacteraceae bacterium]|nr:MAG: 1,4-dihydroxy-2-naphthoate octaprenyltransferase [Xanthobacteraceae bacterium]